MSDFLSKFTKENYQKEKSHDKTGVPEEIIKERDDPGDSGEEVFEWDPSSVKRKVQKRRMIVFGVLAGCFLLGISIYLMYTVKIPDFTEDSVDEVEAWVLRNNLFLNEEGVYDLDNEEGVVISQSPEAGERIFSGGDVEVTVSQGPDPEEAIELPDFNEMNFREIQQWKEEEQAENVIFEWEHHDDIEENQFIKKEFRDRGVSHDDYRREDRLIITVSEGQKELEEDIVVPDFIKENRSKAETWADTEGIELDVDKDYCNEIPEGAVISQSISPETEISEEEGLNITVSRGAATYVPSFDGLSQKEAEIEASMYNVTINIKQKYHQEIPYGELIKQSVPPGTRLEEGQKSGEQGNVILYYSLGLPEIPDLSGLTEGTAIKKLEDLNNRGAEISYQLDYLYDGETPKGTVIFNTRANSRVDVGSTVTVTVSKGGRVIIEDYQGKELNSKFMQEEIEKLKSQGLTVITKYVNSSKPSGTIITQSLEPDQKINTADNILKLEVSN